MEKWSSRGDVHRGIYVLGSQEKRGQEQASGAVGRLITVSKYADISRVMGTKEKGFSNMGRRGLARTLRCWIGIGGTFN